LKTREVPDYLSYAFIALGVMVQCYYLIKHFDASYLVNVLVNFLGGAGFGVLMYKARQWGGADAKIIMALSLCLSTPSNKWLFANYFLNFLLVGAFYGVLGSSFLVVKNSKKFLKALRKDFKKSRDYYFLSLLVFGSGVLALPFNAYISAALVLTGLVVLAALILKNADKLMIKKVRVSELTEGDWVVDRVVVDGEVLFDPKKSVDANLEQISLMKKKGVRSVRIIEGIPFTPSLLLAFLLTMVKQDFFLSIVMGLAFQAFF